MQTLSWRSLATAQHPAIKCYYPVAAVSLITIKYKEECANGDNGHWISTDSFFAYYEC
jgi:hypothetical protein